MQGRDWINYLWSALSFSAFFFFFKSTNCKSCFSHHNFLNVNLSQPSTQVPCWVLGGDRGCVCWTQYKVSRTHNWDSHQHCLALLWGWSAKCKNRDKNRVLLEWLILTAVILAGFTNKLTFELDLDTGFWQAGRDWRKDQLRQVTQDQQRCRGVKVSALSIHRGGLRVGCGWSRDFQRLWRTQGRGCFGIFKVKWSLWPSFVWFSTRV